jgi:predicted NUDIX family NTP pyrophosphohydrolase
LPSAYVLIVFVGMGHCLPSSRLKIGAPPVDLRPRTLYGFSMSKVSAGLLMYRVRDGELEFLLAHPGGPFWKNKDAGAWTIPKGEIQNGEEAFVAARREFEEEIGLKPEGNFIELTSIRQKGGKIVHAWAFEGDCDAECITSNTYEMEWPPRSGKFQTCPEVDRACFFRMEEAKQKINPAQAALLEELATSLGKTSHAEKERTARESRE